jgi:hypothetical protein
MHLRKPGRVLSAAAARLTAMWTRWRWWRRRRPVWAAACSATAGIVLIVPPYATLRLGDVVVSLQTTAGAAGLIIGALMVACAALMLLQPHLHRWAAVFVLSAAWVALWASNLGGFGIGTLLGVLGAAGAGAWSPHPPPQRPAPEAQPASSASPEQPTSAQSAPTPTLVRAGASK